MRVTSQSIYNTLLAGIRNQMQTQDDGTEQISSGRRFNRPSQDGVAYTTSLNIRHTQSGIEASLGAINEAKLRLGVSANALAEMVPIMQRAEFIAVQQANATLTGSQRTTAAIEVAALENQLLALANATFEGKALFSGTATNRDAIVIDGSGDASYNGNAQDRIVAITPTQSIVSNIRGDNNAFLQSFAAIKFLKGALAGNDQSSVQSTITLLADASTAVIGINAEIGGRLSSLAIRENTYTNLETQMEVQLNQHESVDMAEVAMRLAQSEVSLKAAYAEVAKFNQLSLVNFLR